MAVQIFSSLPLAVWNCFLYMIPASALSKLPTCMNVNLGSVFILGLLGGGTSPPPPALKSRTHPLKL